MDEERKDWMPGNIVIHSADAKTERMLMRVLATKTDSIGSTLIKTEYIDKSVTTKTFWNDPKYLHEPRKYGLGYMPGEAAGGEDEVERMAEEHAEFIKQWYKAVFQHGYKHGYEDGNRGRTD